VIDTLTGTIRYDNYEGSWGEQKHLDRFLQMYAVDKAKLEARKKGYTVTEQALTRPRIAKKSETRPGKPGGSRSHQRR